MVETHGSPLRGRAALPRKGPVFTYLPIRKFVVAAACAATFTLFGAVGQLMAQTADLQAPASAEGITTLEEGPIHEAFASPTAADPRQGQVVAKMPPEPVEEVPPEVKPEGDNYKWISGYWQWDPVRNDFVWVSGVYRKFPPNHTWVPGHWAQATGGYTWISGYWESGQRQQAEYLPYPPESLEEGPTSLTPGDDYFWIPGCWEWRVGRYAWRAGYWYQGQPNWIWTPSHYSYTPRGAIYVNGFWDFPLALRGVLYAPVYFEGPFYRQSGFYFTPNYVVDCYDVLPYLYVHRGYNHFYFGRYTGYSRYGFDPWYGGGRYRWYNSLFAYHSWHDDHGRGDWFRDHKRDFDRRKDWDGDRRGRGDRDWDRDRDRDKDHRLTRSYDDWRGEHKGNYRKLDSNERQELKQNANNWQDIRRQRARNEGASKSAENRDFVTQFQGDRTGRGTRREGDGDRQTRLRVPQDGQSAVGQQQFQRRSSDRSQGDDQQFQRRSVQRSDNNAGAQGSQSARTQRSFSNERNGNQGRNLDQSQFRGYQREQSDTARSLRTESGNNSDAIRTFQRRGDSDVQTRSYNRESSQPRSFQRSESQGSLERSARSYSSGDRGSSARSFSGGGGERSTRSFSGGGGDPGSSARSSGGGGSSRGSSARSSGGGGGDRGSSARSFSGGGGGGGSARSSGGGGGGGGGDRGGGGGGGRSSGKYGGGRDRD